MTIKTNCIFCGREFSMSDSQQDFYKAKGYELPKKCNNCKGMKQDNRYEIDTSKLGYKTSSFFSNSKVFGVPTEVYCGGFVVPQKTYVIRVCSNGITNFLQFDEDDRTFHRVDSEDEATRYLFSSEMQELCNNLNKKYKNATYDIFPEPNIYL